MRIPDGSLQQLTSYTERRVGLEFENPLVYHDGSPVTSETIQQLYRDLKEQGWKGEPEQLSHNILSVEKPLGLGMVNVSTDCGWSSIEMALPPADTLHQANTFFTQTKNDILNCLKPGFRWLANGLLPGDFEPGPIYKTTKPFYRLTADMLHFHNLFLALNAHQVGVSIRLHEAIDVVNQLNKIAGLIVALCANSSVHRFSVLPWQDWRMVAWKFLLMTDEPTSQKLAGFPSRPFTSLGDYYKYFWDAKLIPFAAPQRNGELVQIPPMSWINYFRGTAWKGRGLSSGEEYIVEPDVLDLHPASVTHWPFAKLHVVFDPEQIVLNDFLEALDTDNLEAYLPSRFTNLYVEFRPASAAPIGEEMALPALMLGIVENIKELAEFTARHAWGEWKDLVDHAAVAGMKARMGSEKTDTNICDYLIHFVDIAKTGLQKRNMGEEAYLKPLYQRIHDKQTPADRVNDLLRKQGKEMFLNSITY